MLKCGHVGVRQRQWTAALWLQRGCRRLVPCTSSTQGCTAQRRCSPGHVVGLPACASQRSHLHAFAVATRDFTSVGVRHLRIALELGACRCSAVSERAHVTPTTGSLQCVTASDTLAPQPDLSSANQYHRLRRQPANSLPRSAARRAQPEVASGGIAVASVVVLHFLHSPDDAWDAITQMGVSSGHWTLLVHVHAPLVHFWGAPLGPVGH